MSKLLNYRVRFCVALMCPNWNQMCNPRVYANRLQVPAIGRAIVCTFLMFLFIGCGKSQSVNQVSAHERAFLAYWLCSANLLGSLETVNSAKEFQSPPQQAVPTPGTAPKSMNKIIGELYTELESRKSDFDTIPVEVRTQLQVKHMDLTSSVATALRKAEQRQRKSKALPAMEWDRMTPLLRTSRGN